MATAPVMTDHNANPWNAEELLAHCDWVRRLAQTLVRQAADADDLSQDVVAVALEGRRRDLPMHLGAWLRGAATQMARRRSRDEIHRRDREMAQAREISGTDPAELAERAECQRDLIAHLLGLPEVHSSVLLRRYFEGLSPQEIAHVEGKSAGAISHRLSRAHGALRERLERAGGRSEWVSTLLPLLAPGGAVTGRFGPSNVGRAGLFLMGTKTSAIGIGVAALVAAALLFWRLGQVDGVGEQSPIQSSDAALAAVDEEVAAWEPVASQSSPRAGLPIPGSVSVTVEGLPNGPMGQVALRIVGADVNIERDFELPMRPLQVTELPAGVPLSLSLWIDGSKRYEEPKPIELDEGEALECRWTLPTVAGIYGLVTDRAGEPRRQFRVSLVRGGDRFPPTHESSTVVRKVQTDDEGRFQILGVPPGNYGMGIQRFHVPKVAAHPLGKEIGKKLHASFIESLSAEERRELIAMGAIKTTDVTEVEEARAQAAAKSTESAAPRAGKKAATQKAPGLLPGESLRISAIGLQDDSEGYLQLIEVPPGAARVDTTVVVSTDLFIEGHLILPDGAPFQCAYISARREGSSGTVTTVPLDDGRFCLGPLPEGSYHVDAECSYHPWFLSEAVQAEGGASDLRLILSPAASVNGIVRDPAAGSPVPGRFTVTRHAADGIEGAIFEHYTVGYDIGSFWFHGLRPARYTFAFYSTDRKWFGWRRDVDLGSPRSHADFKVPLERASILRVGRSPSGFEREVRIYHQGELARMFTQRPPKKPRKGSPGGVADARMFDYAVPCGRLRIEVTDIGSRQVLEQVVDAVAGEGVDLDV